MALGALVDADQDSSLPVVAVDGNLEDNEWAGRHICTCLLRTFEDLQH